MTPSLKVRHAIRLAVTPHGTSDSDLLGDIPEVGYASQVHRCLKDRRSNRELAAAYEPCGVRIPLNNLVDFEQKVLGGYDVVVEKVNPVGGGLLGQTPVARGRGAKVRFVGSDEHRRDD